MVNKELTSIKTVWHKAKKLSNNLKELLQFTKENNNILYVWHEEFDPSYQVKVREHLDDVLRVAPDNELLPEYEPITLWFEDDRDVHNNKNKEYLCSLLDELAIQTEEWGEVGTDDELSSYMSEALNNWNELESD